MEITKGERTLILATLGALGLLLLDRFWLRPAAEAWRTANTQLAAAKATLANAERLIERREQIASRWADLRRRVEEARESQLPGFLDALTGHEKEAGISDRGRKLPDAEDRRHHKLQNVGIQLAGPLSNIARFLFRLDHADGLHRLSRLRITSAAKSADLGVDSQLSTLLFDDRSVKALPRTGGDKSGDAALKPEPPPLPPFGDYEIIAERNVFRRSFYKPAPAPAPSSTVSVAANVPDGRTLTGIIRRALGFVVMVEDKEAGTAQVLKAGDSIGEARIVSIEADKMTLDENGARREVELGGSLGLTKQVMRQVAGPSTGGTPPTPAGSAAAPSVSTPAPSGSALAQPSDGAAAMTKAKQEKTESILERLRRRRAEQLKKAKE